MGGGGALLLVAMAGEEKPIVLVTGASGFLGGRLCHALIRHGGYRVRALVRQSSRLEDLYDLVEPVYGDLTDMQSLIRACSGCSAVFHCGAYVEPWSPNPSKFMTVNVGGLKNMIEAVKQAPSVNVVIYVSSFFALGPSNGSIADENQIHPGDSFCTEYEKSKVLADAFALQAVKDGLPIVLVYPGVLYGAGKITPGNSLINLLSLRCRGLLPGHLGNGKDRLPFCHVDDVTVGCISAMEKGRYGERYLLTGDSASFDDLLDTFDSLRGTTRSWFRIPLWMLEAVGWISVLWAQLTGKTPLISYPMVHVLKRQWVYTHEKAKRELCFEPRTLRQGIAELLTWMKGSGLIK